MDKESASMVLVQIIKNWDWPDLMQLTPGRKGIWDNIQFTLEPVEEADYVVVLNYALNSIKARCSRQHIWAIMQEPPQGRNKFIHKGKPIYYRIYTQDITLKGPQYIHSYGAMPWHIDRDYDSLSSCNVPHKTKKLSWITSNKIIFSGHILRMNFLNKLSSQVEFDLWGRGFSPITDKWEGLAPYKYSLAIENYRGPFYWSEKISDCFLAWSMPIYYGCTNITDYFPEESMIQIDIKNPDVVDYIQEVVNSDLWIKRRNVIIEARNLILNKYQLMPFLANQISEYEKKAKVLKIIERIKRILYNRFVRKQ